MSMCHLNFGVEGGRVGAGQADQSRAEEEQRGSIGAGQKKTRLDHVGRLSG